MKKRTPHDQRTRAAQPAAGASLFRTQKAVDALLDSGENALALKLASAAAARFPRSPVLAKLLEKALSCAPARIAPAAVYSGLLRQPDACPAHFYNLAMFFKRAGDQAGMRGAFYGFLASRGTRDPIQEYIACCTVDEYAAAFKTAERILDRPDYGSVLSRLWNPWGDRSSAAPDAFFAARLKGLDNAAIPAALEPYRTFLRGALLFYTGDVKGALGVFAALPALPARRYGWMRFPAGWAALYACDYKTALREFTTAAKCAVSRPPALGRIAEVYICTGRRAAGLGLFKKALAEAPLWAAAGLHSWEGQLRLFTGDYRRALRCLDKGAALGDDAAFCWRGAVYSKLGRPGPALADLDKAVRLFPTDKEARVWRGEALRLAGRPGDALTDLDAVLRCGPHDWAFINRALARRDLGDLRGLRKDFLSIGRELRTFLEGLPGSPGKPREAGRLGHVLEQACRLALGNRRDDRYFNPVWMRAPGTSRRG